MRHDGGARVIMGGTRPADVAVAFAAVREALEGGPPLAPVDPRGTPGGRTGLPRVPVPAGTAVALRTSGSSGQSRLVALTAPALVASAAATLDRLGGPGHWLLALPVHHVAGWQVLVRCAVGGVGAPAVLDTTSGFDADDVAAAVAALPHARRYTSLVPTQLVRVLRSQAATRALASFDAVLVGGSATAPDLLRRARDAGLRVVATYGMTETGGGCVYDGRPLAGVRVEAVDGRLEIAGPVLAAGYVGPAGDLVDDGAFVSRDGERQLRTPDLGTVDADGSVHVEGRADDVVVSGGLKVSPAAVERVLAEDPAIAEAVVVGLPDPEWGRAVVAVVVPAPGARLPTLEQVRGRVRAALGREHAPRELVVVDALPLRGPGKPDRARAAALAADILGGRGRPSAGA